MKVRIMLKRIVQPPIETVAGIDYHSIEIELDEVASRFISGADCGGCGVSIDVVGIEKLSH